ncbi:uncharacterized protein M6B38_201950 [Iris pallida]|uniref:protein-serine/threonine phosphatase n=1 Tax=Iris pallida TaxID=29817 RepID=A0AAX6EA43_IRIPA|nr:uncharacterized protein M6B38_201950 [Iris pallida]
MTDPKREANFGDEDLVVKRTKLTDVDSERAKDNGKGDVVASERNKELFTLSDNQNTPDVEQKLPRESTKNTLLPEPSESSKDGSSCNSEVLCQQVTKQFSIEADAAEDKGSRHTMEDAWVVLPDASLEYPGKLRCAHFAIYDGHGGRLAAEYAQAHLHANVLSAGLPRELMDVKAAKKAVLEGFKRTDETLLQESAKGNWQDGATSVCLWVLGQTVIVANIGDAKAVLARTSSSTTQNQLNETDCPLKAIVITREHKAIYPQERARIQKAGGFVGPNGRLQGRLEVSRAFGDRQFKKVGVIATPDVHSFELTEKDHFIILGCDGLWGVFGPSDAVDFVQKQLKDNSSALTAARRLVKEAVRERRCKDNCTAIVIVFRQH